MGGTERGRGRLTRFKLCEKKGRDSLLLEQVRDRVVLLVLFRLFLAFFCEFDKLFPVGSVKEFGVSVAKPSSERENRGELT